MPAVSAQLVPSGRAGIMDAPLFHALGSSLNGRGKGASEHAFSGSSSMGGTESSAFGRYSLAQRPSTTLGVGRSTSVVEGGGGLRLVQQQQQQQQQQQVQQPEIQAAAEKEGGGVLLQWRTMQWRRSQVRGWAMPLWKCQLPTLPPRHLSSLAVALLPPLLPLQLTQLPALLLSAPLQPCSTISPQLVRFLRT